ncbi:hypothetical protein JQ557_12385 [Bradyrhizobium sp. U87765 SZCCT0131]|uniref:hypothetical protein n=1 Tax=unclassified Bradyrhizobium TaxID=2631580 RepID=UPI001BAD95D2|nr:MULTISPECIES: hypothetical protein [unclassified Bradyrhizobium]MBR1218791.1 hypothetical protein [Bradyrhizobium sp. U87765 SZCCT0131]MBR1265450.1 hypothetical protein [Bradyrhizobium sp. U87765 SZCCT0134]MBR1304290.1 hypothetical protein [Bradyrhizobium sp. U87765 SZCCT0110]MBR1319895.1 hypothetical protein [Bradyrhizobium sp. U87765 SZCCT0109]MBR1348221.1 hypothetical protein [Bradyrhizobium sp. U87765 SZCCT0048]
MRFSPSLVAACLVSTFSFAYAQPAHSPEEISNPQWPSNIPSSKPPSQFRQIYNCDNVSPALASALGTITGVKSITIVWAGGKSEASVKELLPKEAFSAGIFDGTRLELPSGISCSKESIAVLAAPQNVDPIQVKETTSPSAINRVSEHLVVREQDELPSPEARLHPGSYAKNYRIADAKVLALSSNYVAVQADILYDRMVYSGDHYEKAPQGSAEPMLFIVGRNVTELTRPFRREYSICDKLVSAFTISGRLQVHVSANGCNNGIKGQMVFDLSGSVPRAVFSDWDLSD